MSAGVHSRPIVLGLIRLIEIVVSALALIALSPVFLVLIVVLRNTGEGQVFFRQIRIGKGQREFSLLKFTTMLKDSSAIGAGQLTLPDDPRVLPLGRFLRKSKLDELPQLWNVLVGDLSFIGPRPQPPRYYRCYKDDDRVWIDKVRPGLSGVGSILFRDETKLLRLVEDPIAFDDHVIMPYKGQVERWYAEHQSLALYLELLCLTFVVVLWPGAGLYKRLLRRVPRPPPGLANILEKISKA